MAEAGSLIVAADFIQAEIATLAYLSGDPILIAAVEAGDDIHSIVAKEMFKLDCTVAEVKKKYKNLRVSAKSLVFGIIYGRGAKAVSREIEKAGVPCSQEEAQEFIERFMARFPRIKLFIESSQQEVIDNRYVETLWGRKEFFYSVEGDKGDIIARQKRQAVNFKIQSYVADLLRLALINIRNYRRDHSMQYKLILTVHDSIMLEVPVQEVVHVATKVLPHCMTDIARAPRLGFKIGADVDVCQRWDEKLYLEDMVEMGLPEEFSSQFCAKDDNGNPKIRSAA
jgi:DNA polymerase-1